MKNKLVSSLVLATLLSGVPHLAQAQAGVVNSTQNPRQIALLYWYSANQTTSFPIPGIPRGFAFDGSNIWVGNGAGQGTVTKLRASDGACVGTCTFTVGGEAEGGVAFDGTYIWVSTPRKRRH